MSICNYLLALHLCFAAMPSLLQKSAPPAATPDDAIKLSTELVLLEADVLSNRTAQAIGGLRKEDFVLYEDGVKQEISHFSQDKLPLSVLLLLDVSSSVLPRMKKLREGALESLQNLKPADEIAVMVFAQKPTLVSGFTKDRVATAYAIEFATAQRAGGETDPNEAVMQAAAYLKNATNADNRRVVIAISDDISTHKALPRNKANAIQELLESGSVVCGLFFESIFKKKEEQQPDAYGGSVQNIVITGETDVISAYVERTGGVAINADQDNIRENFRRLIERLRTRYSFSYHSTNNSRDGKFRKIKLQLAPQAKKREKGIAVITRKGYFAR